jgi:DsbC/DsbD-like thiol-disulfide interchange protein
MKRLLSILFFTGIAHAQHPGTVQWTLTQKPATHADERVLTLHADIEKGWHIYGISQQAGGPMPLVLRVESSAPYQLDGSITGTAPEKHQDSSFNLTTEYFTDAFSLDIPVKQTAPSQDGTIPLAVRFQMCSDTTCMPPRTVHLVAKDGAS